ncbi:hypothetical protein NDU88_003208 [Pleurodeles waltl]|uniref:Uncharacterized protein n=1 Tax=Pleurodeles waltl TaxID=8319 RepID=A0AAV7M3Q0_PLEWA|nr:hypothetical protein NDU88_003208 [Pleurodeles waltl]
MDWRPPRSSQDGCEGAVLRWRVEHDSLEGPSLFLLSALLSATPRSLSPPCWNLVTPERRGRVIGGAPGELWGWLMDRQRGDSAGVPGSWSQVVTALDLCRVECLASADWAAATLYIVMQLSSPSWARTKRHDRRSRKCALINLP